IKIQRIILEYIPAITSSITTPHTGSDVANGLKSFVIEDCAKRFIIFNELPVAVVDTEKVMRSVTGKRRMGESDK
ncbi:unnamed protein product, partial [marine sediment metagenome]